MARGRWIAVALLGAAVALPARAAPDEPEMPRIERRIPDHPASIFDGCRRQDLALVQRRIVEAIQRGAPTYNDGDFRGCYEIYERTARQIEQTLPAACRGPTRALRDGRQTAATRRTDAEKAWAMRDAFDGLLRALSRYGPAR